MSYEDFSIERIQTEFAITIEDNPHLFSAVAPIPPPTRLVTLLEDFAPLGSAIGTEKARSEFIIAPILAEAKKLASHPVSLFSGNRFDVDKEKGLTGYCDFIFCLSASQFTLTAPIVMIVEAKNDNIHTGLGQCMAAMIAAHIDHRTKRRAVDAIYGCVTTGSIWRFLRLQETTIAVDKIEYYLDQLPQLLGVFVYCLDQQIHEL